MKNRDCVRDLTVFALLTAIGVVGRWAQPDWNFTPLMAVTVLGGFYFRSALTAALLPVGILTISNLALDAYDSLAVQASVYAMMIVPVLLGCSARGKAGWQLAGASALCGILPATTFFIVTNFVHWAATSMYEHTWAGLLNCYVAALPFYRTMLVGDVFYLGLLVSCLALAGEKSPLLATERVKK
jgi:hypothetical protein